MMFLSNIFGFLGIFSTICIYLQKSRKSLLISKLLSDVIWLLHYLFLGAYSGAAIAAIGACREIVFVKLDKRRGKSLFWLLFFIGLSLVCTALTWKNIFSLFTCLASCLSVVGFYIGSPRLSRVLSFPISACMLTYDIASASFAGIVNEIFALASSVIGLLIIDRKGRRNVTQK